MKFTVLPKAVLFWFSLVGALPVAFSQGIPEPDLVMFGKVVNVSSNANLRLAYGTLRWVFQPAGGGPPVTASSTLSNINNQISYVLHIPCETPVFGYSSTSNTIQLTGAGITFNRGYVTWNNTNLLSFAQPSQTSAAFFTADRGRIERVDLNVSSPLVIDPFNNLPVDWELSYFGHTGIDPNADPDHDGLNNFAEYRLGTDPNDALSGLRFTEIHSFQGGIQLKWLSEDQKFYALQRASSPLSQYLDIKTAIAGTGPTNTYVDATVSGLGPYFYRLRIDDALSAPAVAGLPFVFSSIQRDPLGGVRLSWLSGSNHVYTLQRSSNLLTGFVNLASSLAATPPTNSYRDATTAGLGSYFYRLRLDQ